MPAASVFHWLAPASEKLPLSRLTASVSPWYKTKIKNIVRHHNIIQSSTQKVDNDIDFIGIKVQ